MSSTGSWLSCPDTSCDSIGSVTGWVSVSGWLSPTGCLSISFSKVASDWLSLSVTVSVPLCDWSDSLANEIAASLSVFGSDCIALSDWSITGSVWELLSDWSTSGSFPSFELSCPITGWFTSGVGSGGAGIRSLIGSRIAAESTVPRVPCNRNLHIDETPSQKAEKAVIF